eukprot:875249-Amphidinium_carterae.1
MLLRLWPAMSEEAGVGEMPVPDTSSLESLLPLVAMSISRKKSEERLGSELKAKAERLEEIRRQV